MDLICPNTIFSFHSTMNSTEFVTVNGSKKGIDLPFIVTDHCMVMFEPNKINTV